MVYAVRTNRPFETRAPLKMSAKESEFLRGTKQFVTENEIRVYVNESGKPTVQVTKKHGMVN